MASQNNGFKTVGSVLIGIFAAGLIAGGIYGTTRFMRDLRAVQAFKLEPMNLKLDKGDFKIDAVAIDKAASGAAKATMAMDAWRQSTTAGASTTQPASPLAAKDLVGTWSSSGSCTSKLLKAEYKSVDVYHEDGTWNTVADTVWTVGKPFFDTETTIHIKSTVAGTWKIDGDAVIEMLTSRDSRPADDLEAARVNASPRLSKVMLSRETDHDPMAFRIVSATHSTVVLSYESEVISVKTTMARMSSEPVATAVQ